MSGRGARLSLCGLHFDRLRGLFTLRSLASASFPKPSLKDQQPPEGSLSPRVSKELCLGDLGSSPYCAV